MRYLLVMLIFSMVVVASGKNVLESTEAVEDVEIVQKSQPIIPLQLSLFENVQMVSKEKNITGLKVNFIYGYNYGIYGIDLGLISKSKKVNALQLNAMNIVEVEGVGLSLGVFNLAQSYSGMQCGVFNLCGKDFTGWQFGFFNYAPTCTGLQLGFINNCSSMRGIQIGLINIIQENGVPFVPIMNMNF